VRESVAATVGGEQKGNEVEPTAQILLVVAILAYVSVRVQKDPGLLKRLLSPIEIKLARSETGFALVVGALVALALFVAIDPEARVFLMFLDSFGVDLFVALCALFVRHNLELCVAILLIPILKGVYRWGPVPGFWPSGVVLRSSVSWAGYAILYPTAAVLIVALLIRCTLIGVWI
jgi:hypothetical protein